MYAEILSIMAPVFLCVAVGAIWQRSGRGFDGEFVSSLVMNIGAPCLIVGTLGSVDIPRSDFSLIVLAALLVIGIALALSWGVCRIMGWPANGFVPSLTFSNTGNMGLPICLFAFGDQGLAVALGLFLVISLLHFSVGVVIISGHFSPRQLLRTPILYSSIIAVILVYTGWHLPLWLHNTVKLLGGVSIPLMLLALGASLTQLRLQGLGFSVVLAVLRLVIGLITAVTVVGLLDLHGVLRGVVIILSCMPAAVFNYLLAARYRRQTEQVAGVVVVSNLLGFLWLPGILWWLL